MPFSSAFPWPSPPPHPPRQVSDPPTPLFSGQRKLIYDLLILIRYSPKWGAKIIKKTWTWLYSNLPHWAPEQKSSRQLEQLYKVTNMVSTYIDQLFNTRDSVLQPTLTIVSSTPPLPSLALLLQAESALFANLEFLDLPQEYGCI